MDLLYMTGSLLRELNTNRLRRLLSILGVIIGTGAVISTLSVVEGGREQIRRHLDKLGVNVVFLEDRFEPDMSLELDPVPVGPMPDLEPPPPDSARAELADKNARKNAVEETLMLGGFESRGTTVRARTLTGDDIEFLRRRFPGAEHVEPQMLHWDRVGRSGAKPIGASLEGGTPLGAVIRNLTPASGRYLCARDVARAEKVCVLGAAIAGDLFGNRNAVGSEIETLDAKWRVVGVLAPKGSMMRFDYDRLVHVPLTTLQERTGRAWINGVLIGAAGSAQALRIHDEILDVVLPRLHDRDREEFTVFCQDELMRQREQTLHTFRILMVAIAAFSLLVSGIGIMNIMLVSVRERTRDIGIWKAVGATDGDVLFYFLGESVLTCVVGGVLGILLGIFLGARATELIAGTMAEIAGWAPVLRVEFVLLSFGTAALVGLLSGLFPAFVAARLEPMEALRYE